MDMIFEEIDRALDGRLFYLAVSTSITLPDLCAAIESPDGETTRVRYKAFYETWLRGPGFSHLPSDEIYWLRCGIIHQGVFTHPEMQPIRVVFTVPSPAGGPGPVRLHEFRMAGEGIAPVYFLDAETFCRRVIEGVAKWYEARQNDPNVKANMLRLVQYRPKGLPPYLDGFPVIA